MSSRTRDTGCNAIPFWVLQPDSVLAQGGHNFCTRVWFLSSTTFSTLFVLVAKTGQQTIMNHQDTAEGGGQEVCVYVLCVVRCGVCVRVCVCMFCVGVTLVMSYCLCVCVCVFSLPLSLALSHHEQTRKQRKHASRSSTITS